MPGPRHFLLPLALLFSLGACDSDGDPVTQTGLPPNAFTLRIDGGDERTVVGDAEAPFVGAAFTTEFDPFGFSLALGEVTDDDGREAGYVVQFIRQSQTVPAVGTYALFDYPEDYDFGEDELPEGEIVGVYLIYEDLATNDDPDPYYFAEAGTLEVTSRSDDALQGRFSMTLREVVGEDADDRPIFGDATLTAAGAFHALRDD